jgi:hypothetical protein
MLSDVCGCGTASWFATSVGSSVAVQVDCSCEAILCTVTSVGFTVTVPNGSGFEPYFLLLLLLAPHWCFQLAAVVGLYPLLTLLLFYILWYHILYGWHLLLLGAENLSFTILLLNDETAGRANMAGTNCLLSFDIAWTK